MRFLVFSDSHGSLAYMKQILDRCRADLDGMIFLGDGCEEFDLLCDLEENRRLLSISVCGNGEERSLPQILRPPLSRVLAVECVRVFLTHGHAFGVSFDTLTLATQARKENCTLALHGHTHIPASRMDYADPDRPVQIFCPGSISQPRAGRQSYGVLTLKNGQAHIFHEEI